MLRRIGVLASLAVCAAMFAGVQSAQAQTAGACIFDGLSGTLSPGIENLGQDLPPAELLVDIERGGYAFTTAGGAAAVCAGLFDPVGPGGPTVGLASTGPGPLAGDLEITSNGFYDNIVCGTGFAHDLDGNATVVQGTNKIPFVANVGGVNVGGGSISATGAGYEIPFVVGNGPLLIGPNGKPALAGLTELLPADTNPAQASHGTDGVGGGMHGAVSSPYTGVGAVHITPDPAPAENCLAPAALDPGGDGDTDAFHVTGFFVAAGGPQ